MDRKTMRMTEGSKTAMVALLLALLLSAIMPALARASGAAPGERALAAPSSGPTDPAELEAFLDGFFARNMAEHHIAGAAIAVDVVAHAAAAGRNRLP